MSDQSGSEVDPDDPPLWLVLEVDVGDEAIDQLQQTGELEIDWGHIAPAPEGWSELNARVKLSYSGEETDYQVRGELE